MAAQSEQSPAPAAPSPALHPGRRRAAAIAMVIASSVVWPLVDSVAKHLSTPHDGLPGVPASRITWGRYTANVVLLLPVVLRLHGPRALFPRLTPLHLLRSAMPAVVTLFFFIGLTRLPFASASALLFVNPLLITAFSAWFLRERIGGWRWVAVAVGFAGSLLVIRPGSDVFRWVSLAPVAAAVAFATTAILNRRLAGEAPPLATTFHYALVGMVALAFGWSRDWQPFQPALVGWLSLMAVGGGLSMWLVTRAYERAQASSLAPFHYVEVACAAGLGMTLFGEFPAPITWAGIALITAAGLLVARE
ncbi:MAG: DMT family transporter [Anaeromyxobacter sp.]